MRCSKTMIKNELRGVDLDNNRFLLSLSKSIPRSSILMTQCETVLRQLLSIVIRSIWGCFLSEDGEHFVLCQ
jgi:hypothetical protein